jgi:predicted RNA methylase
MYMPANYWMLEKLMAVLKEEKISGGFLDVGCGRGRIMAVAASNGFNPVTGVDFAEELAASARENIFQIQSFYPDTHFEIYCEDILQYKLQPETKVIFLFNPFNNLVLNPFLQQVNEHLKQFPRSLYIVYMNPQYRTMMADAGFEEIYYLKKLKHLEGAVYIKKVDR